MSTQRHFPNSVYLVLLLIISLLTPLAFPATTAAQAPLTTIESDATQVARSGIWTAQGASAASGGVYLYSNGSEADTLTLNFSGPSLEVRYISGPSLGTLAIEVDDTVLRTVITTNPSTQYGQSAKIDYLKDEPHTLRVYAQEGGVIAVDAFLVRGIVGDGPVPSQSEHGIAAVSNDEGGIQGGAFCTADPTDVIDRVTESNNGATVTDNNSFISSISADGRYVVFETDATNLIAGDTNAVRDVYRHDRFTCTNVLVSQSDGEALGDGASSASRMTPDGNLVIFNSAATNLVAGDTNGALDVFLRNISAGTTIRVSVATGGAQGNAVSSTGAISDNGRLVVFHSNSNTLVAGDTNLVQDVFVRDVLVGTTERVSLSATGAQGDGISNDTHISADGRYVAFKSLATNLVTGDTNALPDAFVVDRLGLTPIRRVSVATSGTQITSGEVDNPKLSGDGRVVAFRSTATNLVTGDTNAAEDIFAHDLQTGTTTRVSISSNGTQSNGASGSSPFLSYDGRFVGFNSSATNLVTGDTNAFQDVFMRDRLRNTTLLLSLSATNTQGIGNSVAPDFSANGRYIVFQSTASNLVTGDTNAVRDIFVIPNPAFIGPDTLALFNPTFSGAQLINTLTTPPPATANKFFSMTPPATGQWVMGDWDGDGDDTPGVYANGPFFYTNEIGLTTTWRSLWIGVSGAPVSGRFNINFDNDCIGAAQQSSLGGSTVFVLYFTCDLSGNTAPVISSQWLSAVLPDSGGFTGTHQFASGDFNNDRLDSIAVRRGDFIAFGNVAPATGDATFDLAQFIGNPGTGTSVFVAGDWNNDGTDSFALYYANGNFYRRDDLTFNSGVHTLQAVTPLIGTGLTAHAWR